jgi:hypothetical protein
LKSSAAAKRGIGIKYEGLDAAYGSTLQINMPSDMLLTHNKRRTKDSHEDKSQQSEEIKSEISGFYNPKKASVLLHYNLHLKRKLSTKYAEIRQKHDPYLSSGNQLFFDKF